MLAKLRDEILIESVVSHHVCGNGVNPRCLPSRRGPNCGGITSCAGVQGDDAWLTWRNARADQSGEGVRLCGCRHYVPPSLPGSRPKVTVCELVASGGGAGGEACNRRLREGRAATPHVAGAWRFAWHTGSCSYVRRIASHGDVRVLPVKISVRDVYLAQAKSIPLGSSRCQWFLFPQSSLGSQACHGTCKCLACCSVQPSVRGSEAAR